MRTRYTFSLARKLRAAAQAVADGYPDVDEVCPAEGCGTVFKNYHHFISCNRCQCPLSDGKTLFDRMRESLEMEGAKE